MSSNSALLLLKPFVPAFAMLLEITPKSCRLRKAILDPHERKKSEKERERERGKKGTVIDRDRNQTL